VAKKKASLSTVVAFMSDQAQARLEAEVQGAALLPLAAILPDPGQPRRLLPEEISAEVNEGRLSPVEAIRAWQGRAESEPGPQTHLHELARLADSIARHGLINPISVRQPRPQEAVPAGVDYLIVTGERRYWAQVYLLAQERQIQAGETTADPALIKATMAPAGVTVRAHQLIENLLRADINAVERARGLWALRYELSGVNYSSPPAETGEEEEEVNYSSPALEPGSRLVPWARVEETLGISKRYRIFITSVLHLSEAAQAIVAQYDLAEMTIRPIVQKLKDKPELQLAALRQLVAWQAGSETGPEQGLVASVKELVEQLLARAAAPVQEAAAPKVTRAVSSAPAVRFRYKIRQTLDFLNRLKPDDRAGLSQVLSRQEFADVMVDLRNLRQQIDELLARSASARPDAPGEAPDAPSESA
jgi:hypothetical protein